MNEEPRQMTKDEYIEWLKKQKKKLEQELETERQYKERVLEQNKKYSDEAYKPVIAECARLKKQLHIAEQNLLSIQMQYDKIMARIHKEGNK